jgi:beta-glucosidase/6-phospho-beta-glucosidase/beta-galactosidase
VNYENQIRTLKDSAHWYREIIAQQKRATWGGEDE